MERCRQRPRFVRTNPLIEDFERSPCVAHRPQCGPCPAGPGSAATTAVRREDRASDRRSGDDCRSCVAGLWRSGCNGRSLLVSARWVSGTSPAVPLPIPAALDPFDAQRIELPVDFRGHALRQVGEPGNLERSAAEGVCEDRIPDDVRRSEKPVQARFALRSPPRRWPGRPATSPPLVQGSVGSWPTASGMQRRTPAAGPQRHPRRGPERTSSRRRERSRVGAARGAPST